MKKLIVTAVLLIGLSTFAQETASNPRREKLEQMTTQQKHELRIKKITLELGLNASQQKEMGKIITEMEAKREAFKAERLTKNEKGTKPTKDEIFAMQTKLLDEKIANKERIKKILDAKQFEKWEKIQDERMEKMSKFSRGKKREGTIVK